MNASPDAYEIFVFFSVFFYKFTLFQFQVKDAAGTFDHAQLV